MTYVAVNSNLKQKCSLGSYIVLTFCFVDLNLLLSSLIVSLLFVSVF